MERREELLSKVRKQMDEFYSKYRYAREWNEEINRDYRSLMKSILRNKFGLHGGCDDILNEACRVTYIKGWERFIENTEERKETIEDVLEELIGVIFSSQFSRNGDWDDGMTWDRFLKCQWLYQRIVKRAIDGEYRIYNGEAI